MIHKFILSAAVILSTLFILADLDGSWLGKVKTPNGTEIDVTYNFKVDGEKLTGNVVTQWGENPIVNGKVAADSFSFTQTFNDMEIMHSGKIAGDSLVVKIERADNPALDVVFKRAPAK